jgi:Holliday junction resolvase RusA-like endonuclease
MHVFTLAGVPRPKARPRTGRYGGLYQPDSKDEEAVAWQIVEATRIRHMGPVVVAAVFYRPDRHRVDVDNLLKRLLDAGTRARLWRDDSQVIAAWQIATTR